MRIVVDAQLLQSLEENRFDELRLELARLIAGWARHEVFLVLDGRRPTGSVRAAFGSLVPANRIRLWHAPEQEGASRPSSTAKLIREALIASLDADLVIAALAFDDTAADRVFSNGLLHPIPTIAWLIGGAMAGRDCAAAKSLTASDLNDATHIVTSDKTVADRLGKCAENASGRLVVAEDAEAARRWIGAFAENTPPPPARRESGAKPRLAYVSPLPPERSGISHYSAELLPALAEHYDIDLIVRQPWLSLAGRKMPHRVKSARWFSRNAARYDRILYHFGNSLFHKHMFALLEAHPGVVVLHDFFLSGVIADIEKSRYATGAWARELYCSHGYGAAAERFTADDLDPVVWRYPCSGGVLARATGVIVHSESSKALAGRWHGPEAARHVAVIPHLREPRQAIDRRQARRALGFAETDFIVCAFGGLGPTKLNNRLIEAWTTSRLAKDRSAALVFVGVREGSTYGGETAALIRDAKDSRISITGWVDDARFKLYLAAADVAVQLRALSRGETSGTILDCMNAGLPLIVNAHGSLAELPQGTATMLPDEFQTDALVEALETLRNDKAKRLRQAEAARDHILTHHQPAKIAARYAKAIEGFAARPRTALAGLGTLLAEATGKAGREAYEVAAVSAATSVQPRFADRQLLVDISAMTREDLGTGIQRAVRALLREFIAADVPGFRVEPVYATDTGFFYARTFMSKFLGIGANRLHDAPVELRGGDVYFMPDLEHESVVRNRETYRAMRERGISVNFLVHDLLPIELPQFFPAYAPGLHHQWLRVVAEADRVIAVSATIADEFKTWLKANPGARQPQILHSHHGADLAASQPSAGMPGQAEATLAAMSASASFLMVGTVEPRKGHADVLDAFEHLWEAGGSERLVIVGKAGWMIDAFVKRLRRHPESGRRLFWIAAASDEFLEKIYAACTCLIAASYGEGFGLPLVEAAAKGLPILARDIPIFREVAGDHATYFDASTPEDLAKAINTWLGLNRAGRVPQSTGMPRLTWAESSRNLLRVLCADAS